MTLESHLGCRDIDAKKSDFEKKGFLVVIDTMDGAPNDITAAKDGQWYMFVLLDGEIASAVFETKVEKWDNDMKNQLKSLFLEEKETNSQTELTEYGGGYVKLEGDWDNPTVFSTKDDFIKALNELDISTIEHGISSSDYTTKVKTNIIFSHNNIACQVVKHKLLETQELRGIACGRSSEDFTSRKEMVLSHIHNKRQHQSINQVSYSSYWNVNVMPSTETDVG